MRMKKAAPVEAAFILNIRMYYAAIRLLLSSNVSTSLLEASGHIDVC